MLIIIVFEVHTVNLDLILFICLLQFSDIDNSCVLLLQSIVVNAQPT